MNFDTALGLLDRCIRYKDPLAACYRLAKLLKEGGMAPGKMIDLFLEVWVLHEKDPDPEKSACLELVMECIRGDCHPDVAVF